MFIVSLTYQKPLTELDKYVTEHRAFLDTQYTRGIFVVSGPKVPRVGGFIVARNISREDLERVLAQDPFYIRGLARYEVTEFTPVKCATGLEDILFDRQKEGNG